MKLQVVNPLVNEILNLENKIAHRSLLELPNPFQQRADSY